MDQITRAAIVFCHCYDAYQTEYARERLRASLDRVTESPSNPLVDAYQAMIEAYEALHIAAIGEPRPDYVDAAKSGRI